MGLGPPLLSKRARVVVERLVRTLTSARRQDVTGPVEPELGIKPRALYQTSLVDDSLRIIIGKSRANLTLAVDE